MKENHVVEGNPALGDLGMLLGEWAMEISNAHFLPSPSDTAKGQVSFEWVQDGAYLVMRMGDKSISPPAATWLIGRDESAPSFTVLYYDARRVSRVYQMSFTDGMWKMWREALGFWQRYEGKVGADGNTIAGHWETSADGTKWQHDFDVTYTRASL